MSYVSVNYDNNKLQKFLQIELYGSLSGPKRKHSSAKLTNPAVECIAYLFVAGLPVVDII